jgi:hypothetical protein
VHSAAQRWLCQPATVSSCKVYLPSRVTVLSPWHVTLLPIIRLRSEGATAMGSYQNEYRWLSQSILGGSRTEAHVRYFLTRAVADATGHLTLGGPRAARDDSDSGSDREGDSDGGNTDDCDELDDPGCAAGVGVEVERR